MPHVKKTCVTKNTIHVTFYDTPRLYWKKGEKREKRQKPTTEAMERANRRSAVEWLTLLMENNFTDGESWFITATYEKGKEPGSIRELRKDAAELVQRIRKTYRLFNMDARIIYCVGAGPRTRRHIHLVIDEMPDMALIKGCWDRGHLNFRPLQSEGEYSRLAAYFIENAEDTWKEEDRQGEKRGRRYICTRNLSKPVIRKEVVSGKAIRKAVMHRKLRDREGKPIEGKYLVRGQAYRLAKDLESSGVSEITGLPYYSYTLVKDRKPGGPPGRKRKEMG